jgi:hypothetical protein
MSQVQSPSTRATRRAPVKSLNQTSEQVARAAAADKARKAESKRALRASLKMAVLNNVTDSDADEAEVHTQAPNGQIGAPAVVDRSTENLEAAKLEAVALGVSFEAACESMGIDPTTGLPQVEDKPLEVLGYSGPMLALRERSKAGHYVKGTNGNPHCGDAVADALQVLPREMVVRVCIKLLNLEGNPYLHLNPGQQSMNLRNKLRHAVKNGFVSAETVRTTANQYII